jgi:hypothetical protein
MQMENKRTFTHVYPKAIATMMMNPVPNHKMLFGRYSQHSNPGYSSNVNSIHVGDLLYNYIATSENPDVNRKPYVFGCLNNMPDTVVHNIAFSGCALSETQVLDYQDKRHERITVMVQGCTTISYSPMENTGNNIQMFDSVIAVVPEKADLRKMYNERTGKITPLLSPLLWTRGLFQSIPHTIKMYMEDYDTTKHVDKFVDTHVYNTRVLLAAGVKKIYRTRHNLDDVIQFLYTFTNTSKVSKLLTEEMVVGSLLTLTELMRHDLIYMKIGVAIGNIVRPGVLDVYIHK